MNTDKSISLKSRIAVITLIAVGLGSIGASKRASAEGHIDPEQAHGVNRVIRTQSKGYFQVAGNVTASYSNLPSKGGDYTDKPSFYVGGRVGLKEVDAGLQYEPDWKNGVRPGWSAFISVNGDWCSPTIRSEGKTVAWRGSEGGSSFSSGVNFSFFRNTSGEITTGIRIGAIPGSSDYFYYNDGTDDGNKADEDHPIGPWGATVIRNGDLSSASVKRVTAVTRGNGHTSKTDGLQFYCTWSNCGVTRIYTDTNGTKILIGGNWVYAPNPDLNSELNPHLVQYMVDQQNTGYDSPGNGESGAKDDQGNYIVDFPSLNVSSWEARRYSNASHRASQGSVSRYTTETVHINLLTGTRGKGSGKNSG